MWFTCLLHVVLSNTYVTRAIDVSGITLVEGYTAECGRGYKISAWGINRLQSS